MSNAIKRALSALTLLLLAPVLGELVSVHQSPLEFINPLNFLILSLPYGFGALVCRELLVRWKKGWLSLLLLGIAYGIYEEGAVVYSLFDPNWNELGSLARYGYAGGVNWTWGLMTIHFHALISVGASVVIAGLLFPEQRDEPWLGKIGLAGCAIGLLAWVPVMGLINAYYVHRPFPPWGWYAASWLAVLALGWAAYRVPAAPLAPIERKPPRPVFFFLLGLADMTLFFFTVSLTADHGWPPLIVTVLGLLALDAAALWLALRWSGNGAAWDDRHRLALFAGFLGFFIYFGFDQDFEKFQGSSLVAVLAIVALWLLGRTVRRRVQGRT
jgi:hypothetical protein